MQFVRDVYDELLAWVVQPPAELIEQPELGLVRSPQVPGGVNVPAVEHVMSPTPARSVSSSA